jgi:hypothetical protein
MADERMGELLQPTFRYARFRPAASHPHYAWWQRCWGGGWANGNWLLFCESESRSFPAFNATDSGASGESPLAISSALRKRGGILK